MSHRMLFFSPAYILISIIALGLLTSCEDLSELEADRIDSFIKLYGGIESQEGKDLIQTSDGGFLLLGSSLSAGNTNSSDMYVVKTDVEGNEEWSRFIDADDDLSQGDDFGFAVSLSQDGTYILVGYTTLADNSTDPFVVKLREDNQILWKRTVSRPNTNEQVYDVVEASNGDIVLVGRTSQQIRNPEFPNLDNFNLLWYRIDASGSAKIDSAIIGFTGFDEGRAVIRDGEDFLIVGTTDKPTQDGGSLIQRNKVRVIKLGPQGGIINPQEFPSDNSFQAIGVDLAQKENGEVVVLATANIQGISQSWVFDLSSDLITMGNSYFLERAGFSRSTSSGLKQTPSGDWIVSGTLDQGNGEMYLHLLDATLTPIWSSPQSFGYPSGEEQGGQVIVVDEDQYALIGTSDFGNGNSLMALIKTLVDGTLK